MFYFIFYYYHSIFLVNPDQFHPCLHISLPYVSRDPQFCAFLIQFRAEEYLAFYNYIPSMEFSLVMKLPSADYQVDEHS